MKRISFCGTDGYMSPEILAGEDFSLETDVFSLGAADDLKRFFNSVMLKL